MNLNKKLKIWVKRLTIIGLIIFIVCDGWLRIMGAAWDYRGFDTSAVLGALLGTDLYDVNFRTRSDPGFKELDMLKWSKEEWEAPACYLPGKMSYEFGSTRYEKLSAILPRGGRSFSFLKSILVI